MISANCKTFPQNCRFFSIFFLFSKGPFQYDVIMVRWVGSLKMFNFWWQWWQVGGWWGLTVFFDDKRWLILSSAFSKLEKKLCVFVLFCGSKWKKNVSLLLQKNNNFFLYFLFFFGFAQNEKNKFPFCLALNKKKASAISNFLCLFVPFLLPLMMTIDDRWVGGMEFPT